MAQNGIRSIDIYNEQFNHYFVEQLNTMTDAQREMLPYELAFKIKQRGKPATATRLNFQEKVWILSVVFRKNVTIMIDDAENGISDKQFKEAKKAQAGKLNNSELLESMRIHSAFVLSDKDLMQSAMYMSHVSTSVIYELIKKTVIPNVKHETELKYLENKDMVMRIFKFIGNYESKKKRISTDYNFTIPQWYALLYFGTGERLGHDFYTKDFQYAYASNSRNLHKAMRELEIRGLLNKRGKIKHYRYSLSSRGIMAVDRILKNILLNY